MATEDSPNIFKRFTDWQMHPNIKLMVILGPFIMLGLIYALMVSAAQYSVEHVTYDVHTSEYLEQMGLNVDQPHPLEVGAPITGSSGQIEGNGSFFLLSGSASVEGSSKPSSSVRLGLTAGDRSYIIEIPYDQVEFIQSNTEPASAQFVIDDPVLGSRHRKVDWSCATTIYFWCHSFPEQQSTAQDTSNWQEISQKGLPQLLTKHLISVKLTLSPADYKQYLNS